MTDERAHDLEMLATLLDKHPEELSNVETEAFASMRYNLTAYPDDIRERHRYHQLTEKPRVGDGCARAYRAGLS